MAIGVLALIVGLAAMLMGSNPAANQWYIPAGALAITVTLAVVALKTKNHQRFNQIGTVVGVVLSAIALARLFF